MTRSLNGGELAALGASAGDDLFDPARLRATALALYSELGAVRDATKLERARELFGRGYIDRLIEVGGRSLESEPSPWASTDVAAIAERRRDPAKVAVRFGRSPQVAIVKVRSGPTVPRPEVVLFVDVRARAWPRRLSFPLALLIDRGLKLLGIASIPFGTGAMTLAFMRVARSVRLQAYWTLRLSESGDWELARVEAGSTGSHHLRSDPEGADEELIALRADAIRELVGDRGAGPVPIEIASNLPEDPELAVRDLAMVDERFDQRLIETSVIDIVGRWAEASEGDHDVLVPVVADRAVVPKLLDRAGTAIRGARVVDVKVRRVHAMRTPPELSVEIRVRAWRGPRDPTRAQVGTGVTRTEPEWWRLVAGESAEHPWKLADPDVDFFDTRVPSPHARR